VPNAERWTIIERIYHEAVERPVADRPAFLDRACAGDASLRDELESLLANDGPSLLERSALDVAALDMRQQPVTPSWVGRTIRNYEILALIGAGGMGEVYRARDRSLGREVALKLLPHDVSADPERLRRLEREARMLASINHPMIATLYGLEECEGQRFLVMELVPGRTLAERLRQGALTIRDALDICRQIAEGLEAAHDAGVVHRDLKPANVKVAPDGRVKLLDFGLAKALDTPQSGVEPTVPASEATREGTVLGTPAYMSPEQARGQLVDRRTDIWAFGCCLYECLSGRGAFRGNTVTDTLAAVLNSDPDWSAVSSGDVPLVARRLLRRCLAKDVRKRLQHIGDARLELEETEPGANEPSVRSWRPVHALAVLAAAALLIAVGTGLGSWLVRPRTTTALLDQSVARLTLKLEGQTDDDLRLSVNGFDVPLALSPDGTRLVFQASGPKGLQLFLRELAGVEAKALPGTETARTPFFSPDGRWVGFWRAEDRILRKVSVSGGPAIEIASTDTPYTALWGVSDEILIETAGALWSIPADGGKPQAIVVRDRSEGEMISLRARMRGRSDLLVASIRPGEAWLDVLSRETGRRRRLLRGGGSAGAIYAARTGHLVYADADTLFAVAVDSTRFEPVGAPVPVIRGIDHFYWHTNVALSENGTIVYLPAERVREAELVWEDRAGNVRPVPGGRGPFQSAALSPNGRLAAADLVDATKSQVWIIDVERGAKRLLVSEGRNYAPIWSRDGAFVTYASNRGGKAALYRRRADGTGNEERLIESRLAYPSPEEWSPDGRSLLFTEYTGRGDIDIWIYSGGEPAPLIASPFSEASPRFSPDGRFVAFEADDGGVSHVYIQPFPGPGPRTTVSVDEGHDLQWAPGGRQLIYESRGRMMVVAVQTAPVLRIGQPQLASEQDRPTRGLGVTRDGPRFLTVSRRTTVEGPLELRVVLNWFEELERLAPHPRR
jgi:eukaryotic-like serine/threonine-protein kinase